MHTSEKLGGDDQGEHNHRGEAVEQYTLIDCGQDAGVAHGAGKPGFQAKFLHVCLRINSLSYTNE